MEAKEEVKQEKVIFLRPLNMQDFKEARSQVRLCHHKGFFCLFNPFLTSYTLNFVAHMPGFVAYLNECSDMIRLLHLTIIFLLAFFV